MNRIIENGEFFGVEQGKQFGDPRDVRHYQAALGTEVQNRQIVPMFSVEMPDTMPE